MRIVTNSKIKKKKNSRESHRYLLFLCKAIQFMTNYYAIPISPICQYLFRSFRQCSRTNRYMQQYPQLHCRRTCHRFDMGQHFLPHMGQKLLKKEHTVLAFFVIYSSENCHSQTVTSVSIWF